MRIGSPQTFNRYSHALNNPLRFTDPTGLQEQSGKGEQDPCKTHQCQKDEKDNIFYVENDVIIIVTNAKKDDNPPAAPVDGFQAPLGVSTLARPAVAEASPSLASRAWSGFGRVARGIGGALAWIFTMPSTVQAPTLAPVDTSRNPEPENNKPSGSLVHLITTNETLEALPCDMY